MKLAKQSLDAGLSTNNIQPMLRFYQDEVGLPFEELLATGGGGRQHRHGLNGSVLKINENRAPLVEGAPTGYQRLHIVTPRVTSPTETADPDGNALRLLPPEGAARWIEVDVALADIEAGRRHYGTALGFEALGEDTFRCGTTVIHLLHRPDQPSTGDFRAAGFRYLTVQVWDADEEYRQAIVHGATGAMEPRNNGAVARFGFVRDPGGNWLEISQRASLTGPLPTDPQ